MARPPTGFYSTIEYIGPRPQKPKRRNFFGGWVIIVISIGMAVWFGKPLLPFLRATQVAASSEEASMVIASLRASKNFGDGLAAAALQVSAVPEAVSFDEGGGKGVAADVIVRSFHGMDMDLAALLNEDMTANFRLYPQLWGAAAPDRKADSRRVANLQRFLERKAETISPSRNAADYKPGDLVVWSMADAENHIGIVVPSPSGGEGEAWVVHNSGGGVKWENVLFEYGTPRHFRFPVEAAK